MTKYPSTQARRNDEALMSNDSTSKFCRSPSVPRALPVREPLNVHDGWLALAKPVAHRTSVTTKLGTPDTLRRFSIPYNTYNRHNRNPSGPNY